MGISEVKLFKISQILASFKGGEVRFFLFLFYETLTFLKMKNGKFVLFI